MKDREYSMSSKEPGQSKDSRDNSRQNTSFGNRVLDGREGKVAVALELLIGAGTMHLFFGNSLKSIRESALNLIHAANTSADIVLGGPEGMRAAQNLEEALYVVEQNSITSKKAADALVNYNKAKKEFARDIVATYKANEDVARECRRLGLQLKASVKNFFDAGNELKPGALRSFDRVIYLTYGRSLQLVGNKDYEGLNDDQIIARVLENSEQMKALYEQCRRFYDALQKDENTIRQLCEALSEVGDACEKENQKMQEAYPLLISPEHIARLSERWSIEDYLFDVEAKGASIGKGDVQQACLLQKEYGQRVENARAEIGRAVVLEPYRNPAAWIDFALNPAVLGIAAVLILKGAMSNYADNAVSRVLCYPIKKTFNGANYLCSRLYDKIHKGEKK
jgi:hypothetical protein